MFSKTCTSPSRRLLPLALLFGLLPTAASAGNVAETAPQTAASGEEDKMDAVLEELKAIRQVLEKIEKQGANRVAKRPARPTRATVAIKNKPVLGSDTAPVTVVEFTDYQCPYCLRFTSNTFPKLRETFIDTGKVRWVALNLPLAFHQDAKKAAQAAHCAGDQGKFWEMRFELFKNPKALGVEHLPGYAAAVGIDVDAFNDCLKSERHLDIIEQDAKDATAVRLTGTPSFIVGKTTDGDKLTGKVIVGAQPLSVFDSAIKELLDGDAGKKAAAPNKTTGGS
jgi:protein-disulfide isomerase